MNRLLKCSMTFATITNAEKRRSGKDFVLLCAKKLKRPRKKKRAWAAYYSFMDSTIFFKEVEQRRVGIDRIIQNEYFV